MSENNLDKNLDVPDFNTDFPLPLQKVGTSGRIFPIRLKLSQAELFVATCKADVFTELPANRRGIHVSRISEVIQSFYMKDFGSPQQLALELAKSVTESQSSNGSIVNLDFFWTELDKTPATSLDSIQSYEVFTSASTLKSNNYVSIGVKVPSITACPCVQLNAREYYHRLNLDAYVTEEALSKIPLYSHSQRVLILVQLKVYDLQKAAEIDFRHLIQLIRGNIPPTFDLLKRIDEVKIVENAHAHPLFSEDIARKLAVTFTHSYSGVIPEDSDLAIEVTSLESIHSYNLHTELKMKLGEIRQHLD